MPYTTDSLVNHDWVSDTDAARALPTLRDRRDERERNERHDEMTRIHASEPAAINARALVPGVSDHVSTNPDKIKKKLTPTKPILTDRRLVHDVVGPEVVDEHRRGGQGAETGQPGRLATAFDVAVAASARTFVCNRFIPPTQSSGPPGSAFEPKNLFGLNKRLRAGWSASLESFVLEAGWSKADGGQRHKDAARCGRTSTGRRPRHRAACLQ